MLRGYAEIARWNQLRGYNFINNALPRESHAMEIFFLLTG